jgi:RNA-directed DNA polymerase
LARSLADAFLAGPWDEAELTARAQSLFNRHPAWIPALTSHVLASYHRPPADRPRELARFVALWLEGRTSLRLYRLPRVRRRLAAELATGRRRWPVPEISSLPLLAEFLQLSDGRLDWLADARGFERTVPDTRLRNYHYAWLPRRYGPPRLIERPKAQLKSIQRRLLHELLDWIPAHEAAHGFTRGRSARSHAAIHVGSYFVLRLDLEDFFASVSAGRVFGIFRTAGYPEPVAYQLTALTTNAVPVAEWAALPRPTTPPLIQAHHRLGRRLATPHLPQGAPTSPALANLAAFSLDRRLSGLARALGASYSRYADDLTLSGPRRLARHSGRIRATIAEIAGEEGFRVNERKTVFATRAGRQRVCGIVVNEHPNVTRAEYDELKAILHNAARDGPAAQNRSGVPHFREHLMGRIAWVEALNPQRGSRLRERFARIDWTRQ